MADTASSEGLEQALVQPERGLYIAPIRHHSPACAWAVKQMIQAIRPKQVLIESPVDFAQHIPVLLNPETKPPVAIAALVEREQQTRLAAYYPFCSHSPEYIALKEGEKLNAELRFIDLASIDKTDGQDSSPMRPLALNDEAHFDSGDYIAALARETGCRDGFELWDHLFETRLGTSDWQGFFADTGAYCAGIRAATPQHEIESQGDAAREAFMSAALHEALSKAGPVVVVIGGFHVPALLTALAEGNVDQPSSRSDNTRSYLIRYGFAALDALNGYAAGLPQPAYYDFLWQRAELAEGKPQWRETALDLVSQFAAKMRRLGHPINVPAQVEMLRAAEALALLRGRPGALRHDLIDGARTALIKGEAGGREVWTERLLEFLRGEKIGDVPASAGSPPLVEDARSLARRHRIDVSDGARRRRKLDIRRKPAQLAASHYFHAMELLGTHFAERELGPDYLNNARTELLFEQWNYAWSPQVEGRLIELAALADQVPAACLRLLEQRRAEMHATGQSQDLAGMVSLFVRGLLAGLGHQLGTFLNGLEHDIQSHGDFSEVAVALQRLHFIANATGPMGAPETLDLGSVRTVAYLRLIYLCDDLPKTPAELIPSRLDALRLVMTLFQQSDAGVFDQNLFDEAIDRVAEAAPPAEILGSVLALCLQSGRRDPEHLSAALSGYFSGSRLNEQDQIGVLRGILHTAPALLWQIDGLAQIVDRYLCALPESRFLNLLPYLRLAFTHLNPRETDRLAAVLGQLHDMQAGHFVSQHTTISAEYLQQGLVVEQRFREAIAQDHLSDWILQDEGEQEQV